MNKLSAVLIVKNEAHQIERCLSALQWVDELVVVDTGSDDDTVNVCKRYNCRLIETEWLGFGKTKKRAVGEASHDWILSLDADEVVTPALKDKIEEILASPEKEKGYRIRRQSFYLGKHIRFSGWNRDYPLRLFDRRSGNFNDKAVHESVHVEGKTGVIEEPLWHYPYPDLETHIRKINRYTTLGAQMLREKHKSVSVFSALVRAKLKFLKMYVLQAGFLDGKVGLILALNSAYSVYLKYLKLWQLNK